MVTKKALLGMVAILATMSALLVSCTKEQQQVVKNVVKIADTACVIIRHVGPDGIMQEVCAYEEELSPLVPVILTGRAHKAAGAAKDAGDAVADATPAPTADQCMAACSAACQ